MTVYLFSAVDGSRNCLKQAGVIFIYLRPGYFAEPTTSFSRSRRFSSKRVGAQFSSAERLTQITGGYGEEESEPVGYGML